MPAALNQAEYAKHIGKTRQYVNLLIREGKIPPSCIRKVKGRKLIDPEKADKALADNLDRLYNPPNKERKTVPKDEPEPEDQPDEIPKDVKSTTEAAGTAGMSMATAQKIQAQYKAALLKLEFDEKSKQLVPVEKVKEEAYACARIVRDAILNIPDRISAELASITDVHVISDRLIKELTEALEELTK